jgi:RNA polymerase sigma factor (sigma-70 family)
MASAAPESAPDRAFESLYRQHVGDVYRYALALLRNPADAEDVTQTTFMNAYRAVQRGEEIEKPQNWLIKIAHNAARSRYARAARRLKEVPLEDHLEQLAIPEADRVQVGEILDALGRLPLNQRAALVMRELEGRTYAEIADTLAVSVSAVETLIFRARRSLRVKAAAIRVLAVVPAPGWLSDLLDVGGLAGGGTAAGGGAAFGGSAATGGGTILGSGILLKTAVAIVAGAVASGLSSDIPRRAAAAARSASKSDVSMTRGAKATKVSSDRGGGARQDGAAGAAASVVGSPAAGGREGAGTVRSADGAGPRVAGPARSSTATPSAGSPAPTTAAATQVVSSAVTPVVHTAPLPTVPSLPLSSPVPTPSVQVPSAPVLPPTPPVQVPSPSVQPPTPPVQLPPPPVQAPLP